MCTSSRKCDSAWNEKDQLEAEQDKEGLGGLAYLIVEAHPALLHHPLEPGGPVLEGATRGGPMTRHDLAKKLQEGVAAPGAQAMARHLRLSG